MDNLKQLCQALWTAMTFQAHRVKVAIKTNSAGAFLGYVDTEWGYKGIIGSELRIPGLGFKLFVKKVVPAIVIERLQALAAAGNSTNEAAAKVLYNLDSPAESAVEFVVEFPTQKGVDKNSGTTVKDRNNPERDAQFPVVRPGQQGAILRAVLASQILRLPEIQQALLDPGLLGHIVGLAAQRSGVAPVAQASAPAADNIPAAFRV